jgi:hypothetical protein
MTDNPEYDNSQYLLDDDDPRSKHHVPIRESLVKHYKPEPPEENYKSLFFWIVLTIIFGCIVASGMIHFLNSYIDRCSL